MIKNNRVEGRAEQTKSSSTHNLFRKPWIRSLSIALMAGVIAASGVRRDEEAKQRNSVAFLAIEAEEAYNNAVRIQGCTHEVFLNDRDFRKVYEYRKDLEYVTAKIMKIGDRQIPLIDSVINFGKPQAGLDQLPDEFVNTVIRAGYPGDLGDPLEGDLSYVNPACH